MMKSKVAIPSLIALAAIACTGSPANAQYADIESAYNKQIQEKATSAVARDLGNLTPHPISTAGAGEFPWFWENSDNAFNANTLKWINGGVVPDKNGTVKFGSDSFSNAYLTVINAISYKYSNKDKQVMNAAQSAASTQATAVTAGYQQIYGQITAEQMKAAKVETKIDYVINYKVAQEWAGGKTPLEFTAKGVRNIQRSLPKLPSSAGPLLAPISLYLNKTSKIFPLINASNNAVFVLGDVINNVTSPTLENGSAIATQDAAGGKSTGLAYAINKSVTDIQNNLGTADAAGGNSFTIKMTASKSNDTTVNAKFSSGGGFSIPLDFIKIGVSGGQSLNVFSQNGSSEDVDISMTYSGVTYAPVAPAELDLSSLNGWFYSKPIRDAVAAKDVSGYHWAASSPPNYDFAKGGNFGRINGVIISQYPTIKIVYKKGDFSKFKAVYNQTARLSVKLFGFLPIGGAEESLYAATTKQDSKTGAITITMGPSPQVFSVTPFNKRTYIVGATVNYPGAAE